MNRGAKEEQGTLKLARDFVHIAKSLEKTRHSTWLGSPGRRLMRKWLKPRQQAEYKALINELGTRYAGMLYQMFRRAGHRNGRLNELMVAAWVTVQQKTRTLDDHRRFSPILWESAIEQTQAQLDSLKPKFMLRQFVDEMPPGDERGTLRALAYGPSQSISPVGKEVLRLVSQAYLLHSELLKHLEDLPILTDNVILPKESESYEDWLFRS